MKALDEAGLKEFVEKLDGGIEFNPESVEQICQVVKSSGF